MYDCLITLSNEYGVEVMYKVLSTSLLGYILCWFDIKTKMDIYRK